MTYSCDLAKAEAVGKNYPVHVLIPLEVFKEITFVLFLHVYVTAQYFFSVFRYIFFLFLFFLCGE